MAAWISACGKRDAGHALGELRQVPLLGQQQRPGLERAQLERGRALLAPAPAERTRAIGGAGEEEREVVQQARWRGPVEGRVQQRVERA
jgi:hypothetical protein